MLLASLVLGSAQSSRGANADSTEQDQFEERLVNRWVERGYRFAKTDRMMWIKELEKAFPNQKIRSTTEEDYLAWYVLLAGTAAEWRRDDAPNTQIAELYDRVLQRLELGPVPSIRRDEFVKYIKHILIPANPPPPMPGADPTEDADKVFRVLDRNGDGFLQASEFTAKLREDRLGIDPKLSGKLTKAEYREYFQTRVSTGIETTIARREAEKAAEKAAVEKAHAEKGVKKGQPEKSSAMKLPNWFTELDTDMDGQIALSEWRKGGRSIAQFMEMDLDGDGLLTKIEYFKYMQMKLKSDSEEPTPVVGKQAKK